jgi:hypothetical protein
MVCSAGLDGAPNGGDGRRPGHQAAALVCVCGGDTNRESDQREWIGFGWTNLPVEYGISVRHGYGVIGGVHKFYTLRVSLLGFRASGTNTLVGYTYSVRHGYVHSRGVQHILYATSVMDPFVYTMSPHVSGVYIFCTPRLRL